jgi:outer membrane protein assembly factor BamB
VVAVLGLGAAYLLHALQAPRDVRGSSTVEFVPTETVAKTRQPGIVWPMYGFGAQRLRVAVGSSLAPPFRSVWTFRAKHLVEFPPGIAYGRLYFSDNPGVVFALSTQSGRPVWRYDAGRCQAASPAIGFRTVYMTFLNHPPCNATGGDGELVALNADSGAVRWRRSLGPSESSPLLEGDRVYVGDWNGMVYCFAARSGKLIWRFQADGKVKGGLAFSNGRVYFGTYGSSVYALDAAKGTEIWKAGAQPGLVSTGTFYSTPAVAYDRVYIGSTDGKMYSFGATSGALRWSQSTGGYVYSSPAVWHERVYAGSYSGSFFCFDAATGAVLWSFRANGPISGSPTLIAGRVYFSTLRGTTYALDALGGHEVWTFADGKYSPVVADAKQVYLVGYTRLYGLVERRG